MAVDQWYDFHEFGCHLGNVGLMGLLVPIAFVLLLGGLAYTLRITAKRCGEADELMAQGTAFRMPPAVG